VAGHSLRIKLDQGLCEGYGTCAVEAPELFELDDLGYASLTGDGSVPGPLEVKARRAIAYCPMHAIQQDEQGPADS
jgi:ferredoxin